MRIVETLLAGASFALVCFTITAAPWLFGAWEMWWFWPFAVCIFATAFFFSIRLVFGKSPVRRHRLDLSSTAVALLACFMAFLIYAGIRARQAPVYMDAERSFMLFATCFLLASIVAIGFSRPLLRTLHMLVFANLLCLGVYGIVNHMVTGSTKVLWETTTFTQYAGRATGSYYCPDHFSGLMELLFALSLGLLLAPHPTSSSGTASPLKTIDVAQRIAACVAIPISLCGVWLSQSRGGGLTVLAVGLVVLLVWTARFRPIIRWGSRLGGAAVLAVVLLLLWNSNSQYIGRFKEFVPSDQPASAATNSAISRVGARITGNIRYNIYSAALRAWRDGHVLFGIGPGMHQHLWFHYCASPDGDRTRGIWPTRLNIETHAHQTHNDWLQLLEEYGIVGFTVFAFWLCMMLVALIRGFQLGVAPPLTLGAILCIVSIALHSLVDFNLQIPATAWLFATIIAIPIAFIERTSHLH